MHESQAEKMLINGAVRHIPIDRILYSASHVTECPNVRQIGSSLCPLPSSMILSGKLHVPISILKLPPRASILRSAFASYTIMHAPAVLALVLLPVLATALDASCAPVACGDLSIRYPFWLRGQQPSHCGYPSFGVACDPTGATPPILNDSYLRILDIHYGNSSVVAFHANLAAGDASACRATYFNTSTSLALSLLAVSRANWELILCTNCSRQPPARSLPMNCSGSGAWFMYLSQRHAVRGMESAAGCHFSVMPVLPGSELRAQGDYAGLVRRGFLLEWTVPGDCAACNASGGQCRYDNGANAFRCLCPDGRLQPATCARGELLMRYSDSLRVP
ncbi:LEAF RUST 10 DISEASE-RESISTANCE LOCUS RECEPTOR-LIKE PROTEIN KINASE-like 1.2 [Phragmites australis]|uniref:LEAF RUST 10 DISEASE-RESISTANCE LOCUS RECEPTOR-LIKE PROTEIN KINASE-like 1.2 n=1 Tax=Phragmites australis TaxID=29695 RepID=UPI002D76D2E0|nr:LEAF RUST 10 DISEASE-RESISTANCE LOCUS RECEPTOR-LIKE PROTEIN KINASE-like 1.2 [Phragmites australis]